MSDCSCIYVDYDDYGDILRNKIVKARKQHICTECGIIINIGDKYESFVGVWEGELESFKTCETCLDVRRKFFCETWVFGKVWEYIRRHIIEHNGNISSECLTSLSKPAKDKVCDMIEEYWEETKE